MLGDALHSPFAGAEGFINKKRIANLQPVFLLFN